MKRLFALLAMMLAFSSVLAVESLQIGGFLRQHSSVVIETGELALIQNTLDLDLTHSRGDFALRIDPYIYQVPGEEIDWSLRQAYIDLYWSSVDLRVGRQQVVWGKADGVFITDLVSPKDLRRFLLPDFEEIRIGVDAVKLNYYHGSSTFELIWIPVFAPTLLPENSSIWERTPSFPLPVSFDMSEQEVEASLENSEIFGKYSLLSSNIDLELMAGYAWDDDPAFHIETQLDSTSGNPFALIVRPGHHRLALVGGSFSTEVAGFILRGEGAYYKGKKFSTENPLPGDGVLERDSGQFLVGLDRSFLGLNWSIQVSRAMIFDYDESLVTEQNSDLMTLMVRDDFLHETLHLELFGYYGLTDEDALLRPKISYDLADGLEVMCGVDLFIGDGGKFGAYSENDLIYSKIKYSF